MFTPRVIIPMGRMSPMGPMCTMLFTEGGGIPPTVTWPFASHDRTEVPGARPAWVGERNGACGPMDGNLVGSCPRRRAMNRCSG